MTDLAPLFAHAGANTIDWELPALPGRAMKLHSARPARITKNTPILFVHHGMGRNGDEYRDYWLPLVDEADVMAIAPEFPTAGFPGAEPYNFGNRIVPDGALTPRSEWTYNVDQIVFAGLHAQGLTNRSRYGLFGHSAGSQFVQRMIALGFRGQVAAAVAANAGSYAMADLDIAWPYGLGGCGLDAADLSAVLGFRLTIMAGTLDNDGTAANVPNAPEALAQGPHRHARAHAFTARARAMADSLGAVCAFTVLDVAGVGHSGELMSAAAAPILSAALHAG